MGILDIQPAVRSGARTMSVFAGVSGSGKTLSAIYMAYGMANYDATKIGFLDAEKKRGRLYADALKRLTNKPTDKLFRIADLVAPYSPARYRQAVIEFQDAGVEVLVIDSGSHEWEGLGGCSDIAEGLDSGGSEGGGGKHWNRAKREHRRFVDTVLQSDMHVIVCLRAREKVKIEGRGKDQRYTPLGILPICEKNFMFEATLSLLMYDETQRTAGKPFYDRTKVPADLLPFFPGDRYITHQVGYEIRRWVDGGGEVDPKVEGWKNRLLTNTEQGERHIETCWLKVPAAIQDKLGAAFKQQLFESAREFDRQRELNEEPEAIAEINRELAGEKPAPVHLDFS